MDKLKIYYLNSTHWDREWYLPFQGFRYNLVKIIDDMISKLENDDEYKIFTLDGQTIVLEDYKAISKKRADKLKKMIEDGRVLVGPWYVMPDELLVSGESLIRNLMFGEKTAKEWNTETWKYGYVNDVFGHIAQMPQIFAGFDIKGTYLGRGLGNDTTVKHFVWQSPDGTEVLGYHGFYGGFLLRVATKYGTEDFRDKLRQYIDEEKLKSSIPKAGFAFISAEGLHEAGVEENGNIYITMLRSFKKVFLQPDAQGSQIQGKLTYHYAFCPTNAETKYSDLLSIQRNLEDNVLYSLKNSETDNLCQTSFVKSSNDNIVLSILKVAEDEEGIIIRLYNASDFAQTTKIKLDFDVKEIWKTKLNEEKKELITQNNVFELSFKPWEIVTILVNTK